MTILGPEERRHQILLSRSLGRLFPLWGIIGSPQGTLMCECGKANCKSPGKHPRPGFLRRATTDIHVVGKWLDRLPHANFGVVTGELTIAVDVDVRADENGIATLDYLEIDEGSRIPFTVEVLTGRGNGSRHLFFKVPSLQIGIRAKALPGIDVRATGGYCVAAGSRHVCGGYYHFPEEYSPEEQSIANMPGFLLAALSQTPAETASKGVQTRPGESAVGLDASPNEGVAALPDRIVLGVMMRDPVARFYWQGGRRNRTPSEDDFALACKLSFYCRHDLRQMHRLFMQSGLRRPKFDEPRPGGTYATWTLRRAIEATPHTWVRKDRRVPGAKLGRPALPTTRAIRALHLTRPELSPQEIGRDLGVKPKQVRNAIAYLKRVQADNSALIHNLGVTQEARCQTFDCRGLDAA